MLKKYYLGYKMTYLNMRKWQIDALGLNLPFACNPVTEALRGFSRNYRMGCKGCAQRGKDSVGASYLLPPDLTAAVLL